MLASGKWKVYLRSFLFLVPLLFVFFNNNVFAEEVHGKNILEGVKGYVKDEEITSLTDGDSSTYYDFAKGSEVVFKLSEPTTLSGFFYLDLAPGTYRYKITFVRNDGSSFSNSYVGWQNVNKFIPVNEKNIITIKIAFEYSGYDRPKLAEFKLFEKEKVIPSDISNFDVKSLTYDSVQFSYTFPKENFSYMKVFRDGKLIANKVQIEEFSDEKLDSETSYTYRFVTVNDEGIESKGYEKNIKTEQKPNLNKPAKPPNLNITSKDGALLIGLTNYDAGVPVKGYYIFIDGKRVTDSLVTSRSYFVNGLKNGQTYQVQVKAVSKWNVESDLSNSVYGIPQAQVIPDIAFNFGLSELIESIKNWFGGIWPIVAFSIAIPLAFIVAFNTKKLFLR